MKSLLLISIAVGVVLIIVAGLANQESPKETRFDDYDDDDNDDDNKDKYVPSREEAPIFYGA